MSPLLQSVLFFLVAALAFLAVGSLFAALVARAVARPIASFEPSARYRALVVLAALPLVSGFVLLLSASLPSILALAFPALDHCLTHDDGHAHLCFVHLPSLQAHVPVVLGLTFLASYAAVRIGFATAGVTRALRVLRTLTATGSPRPDLGVTLLETRAPLCITAGLLHPSVLISRGLFELLSDDERNIVLAHEHAHARRRDALVVSLARICSAMHLPGTRGWIVRELEVAAEQACDEDAGRVAGDRAAVAAAILRVERATQHHALRALGALAVGAGTCAVERRVRALLDDPLSRASLGWFYGTLGLVVTVTLAAAEPLHHATEAFLSMLVH